MKIFKLINDINFYIKTKKQEHLSIGFVPTMGALHKGHISLIANCKKHCDIAIASIFVNPSQFNDASDLEKYPRTIAKDIQALLSAGCDVLFFPDVEEIYPNGEITRFYDLGELEKQYEGAFRPGHFQGVCQVVDKLFKIVQPDKVFFGQKDYQQCMVIKKLIQLTPAFSKIDLQIVSTMREETGLAMSSRNMRLTQAEKTTAATIFQTMLHIKQKIKAGNLNNLLAEAKAQLEENGFKIDYVSIADATTLAPITIWDGSQQLVVLVAAFLGSVRLIDNLVIA